MSNIWELLLYSLDLSLFALLILLLKKIFKGRLSPNWHYSIWSILAFKGFGLLLVRADMFDTYDFVLNLAPQIENGFDSSFSQDKFLNFQEFAFGKSPSSITDWLFVVYILGVLTFLMISIIKYVNLKLYIKSNSCTDKASEELVEKVAQTYSLKSCDVVCVDGFSSAMICGFFKPMIILPKGEVVDEKVILHELIHLKYHDNLKSICWHLLRAMNWCNIFLQFVFDTISNDIEISRDHKVLELLDGEERRDYGRILLFMADDKYASVLGTTSVANGGKNIKKRIEMMLLFKKYPKDLAIITVCIFIMIFSSVFYQFAACYFDGDIDTDIKTDTTNNTMQNEGCLTAESAIDTFANGLGTRFPYYLAFSSPKDEKEKYSEQLYNEYKHVKDITLLTEAKPFNHDSLTAANEMIYFGGDYCGYDIIGLEKSPYDNKFTGTMVLFFSDYSHGTVIYKDGRENTTISLFGGIMLDFEVFKENQFWVFDETSDFEVVCFNPISNNHMLQDDNIKEINYKEFGSLRVIDYCIENESFLVHMPNITSYGEFCTVRTNSFVSKYDPEEIQQMLLNFGKDVIESPFNANSCNTLNDRLTYNLSQQLKIKIDLNENKFNKDENYDFIFKFDGYNEKFESVNTIEEIRESEEIIFSLSVNFQNYLTNNGKLIIKDKNGKVVEEFDLEVHV